MKNIHTESNAAIMNFEAEYAEAVKNLKEYIRKSDENEKDIPDYVVRASDFEAIEMAEAICEEFGKSFRRVMEDVDLY